MQILPFAAIFYSKGVNSNVLNREVSIMPVTEVRSLSQLCHRLEANKESEHMERFPPHILALIWFVMIAGCFLFWVLLLYFLLPHF